MIDAPPLCEAVADPDYANDDAIAAAKVGLSIEEGFLGEYAAAHRERLAVAWPPGRRAAAIAALAQCLAAANWFPTIPSLQASAHVLTRPVSAWLVVTLVSMPLVLPDAPLIAAPGRAVAGADSRAATAAARSVSRAGSGAVSSRPGCT